MQQRQSLSIDYIYFSSDSGDVSCAAAHSLNIKSQNGGVKPRRIVWTAFIARNPPQVCKQQSAGGPALQGSSRWRHPASEKGATLQKLHDMCRLPRRRIAAELVAWPCSLQVTQNGAPPIVTAATAQRRVHIPRSAMLATDRA